MECDCGNSGIDFVAADWDVLDFLFCREWRFGYGVIYDWGLVSVLDGAATFGIVFLAEVVEKR